MPAYIIQNARVNFYIVQLRTKEAQHSENVAKVLYRTIAYLGIFSNLVSFTILILVIRLLCKRTRSVSVLGRYSVSAKIKLNTLVTVSHILVALSFSITQVLPLFAKNNTKDLRMASAFYFFGGAADLFLSVMLWFIFD